MTRSESGPNARHYSKPGRVETCGGRIGTYAGAVAHWRIQEDPCTRCGEAARVYWRELRASRRDRPVEEWPHGKPACYKDYGCRRDECRDAARNYRKRNNARRARLGLPSV